MKKLTCTSWPSVHRQWLNVLDALRVSWCTSIFSHRSSCRVLGGRACVAEAVRYYASHSLSVQSSKKNLHLANQFHVGEQPLSHCRCTEGQLVHINFFTPVFLSSILGRRTRVWPKLCYYAFFTVIFSAEQQEKAHSGKACLCQ